MGLLGLGAILTGFLISGGIESWARIPDRHLSYSITLIFAAATMGANLILRAAHTPNTVEK